MDCQLLIRIIKT